MAEFNRRKECCTAPPENDSILPYHGYNLTENLSVGTVNRGVGVIFRQQPDMAALAGKALDCGLIVDHGHHDLTLVTGLLLAHYHQIAGQNSGVQHGFSPDPQRKVCVAEATGIKGQVILNTFLRQNGAAGSHISHNGDLSGRRFVYLRCGRGGMRQADGTALARANYGGE